MNAPPVRRSMSAALSTPSLPPEALQLIREGTPQPKAEKTVIALKAEDEPRPPPEPVRKRTPKPDEEPVPVPSLVFTSLRLPAEVSQALLEASLDRRLKRLRPWTQQDIASRALSAWLKEHGYLK